MDNDDEIRFNEEILSLLRDGLAKGFQNDQINLSFKNINNNMMDELCKWLIELEGKAKILNLENNNINSAGASKLYNFLNKSKSTLSEVWLIENQIDDECMESVGNYIKNNPHIEVIDLSNYYTEGNDITDKGIEILSPYLEGNKTFKQFRFYGSKGITDKSIPFLLKMIETTQLVEVDKGNTSITQGNVLLFPLINNILKYGYSILNIRYRYLTDVDIIGFCDLMKKNGYEKVKQLFLNGNQITSEGGKILFETLQQTKSNIKEIYFNTNLMDDNCMEALGKFIESNKEITSVDISNLKLSNKGVEILSDYIFGNTTLKSLDISWNRGITDESVPIFIEIIERSSLVDLGIRNLSITFENQEKITKYLEIPIDQRQIPITSSTKSANKKSY